VLRFFRDLPGYLGRFRDQWGLGLSTLALAAVSIVGWATGKRLGLPGGIWITLTFFGVFLSGYGVYHEVRRPDPAHEDHLRQIVRETQADVLHGRPSMRFGAIGTPEKAMTEGHFPLLSRVVEQHLADSILLTNEIHELKDSLTESITDTFGTNPGWFVDAVREGLQRWIDSVVNSGWGTPLPAVRFHRQPNASGDDVLVLSMDTSGALAYAGSPDEASLEALRGAVFLDCLRDDSRLKRLVARRDALIESRRAVFDALGPFMQPGRPIPGRCPICAPPRSARG